MNSYYGSAQMTDRRRSTTTSELERRRRNRRAFPRWALDFDVRISWEKQSAVCRGYEIGAGGLSLTCERELPAEIEIDLQYRLGPQTTPVSVKCTLRHVEGNRFGIEFLNLGLKDRLTLMEYCEKLKMV